MEQSRPSLHLTLTDGMAIKQMSIINPYSEEVARRLKGLGNPNNVNIRNSIN